jgi:hypothetical protein
MTLEERRDRLPKLPPPGERLDVRKVVSVTKRDEERIARLAKKRREPWATTFRVLALAKLEEVEQAEKK